MYFKTIIYTAAAIAAVAAADSASATSITVTPWVAPNAFGSPSYNDAISNQFNALYTGASSAGTPNTPAYYHTESNITRDEVIVTNFTSWKGSATPGVTYGTAYANELGTRPMFGLSINGDGTQFSISQLSFVATSNDADNSLGFSNAAGAYNYGGGYVGILFGADHALGGGDDTFITSGANTQLIDYLIGRGSGTAYGLYCGGAGDPACGDAENQAQIDGLVADPTFPTAFSGTYSLGGVSGTGAFDIAAVPEASSWAMVLAGLGLAGVAARRRRRVAIAA